MNNITDLRFAVLIDADNVPASAVKEIMEEIAKYGTPTYKRIYSDWTRPHMNSWKEVLLDNAITPIQQYSYTKGKNASDIGLVIDAMDILHTGRFDGFVIVSSDSDFTALASRLREGGVDVIGIGEKKAPDSFRNVCNRFVQIKNIVAVEVEAGIEAKPPTQQPIKQPVKLIKLIDSAMRSIDSDDEWHRLGVLGSHLVRANPEFDARNHGRAKLSELVAMLKPFEMRKQSGHFEVRKIENGKP